MRNQFKISSMNMVWALPLLLVFHCNNAEKQDCYPSSCGSLRNIRNPFRLKDHPKTCGRSGSDFEIACESNQAVLYLNSSRYFVNDISYKDRTIRILDPVLRGDNCSSLPSYDRHLFYRSDLYYSEIIVFVNCSVPVEHPSYVATGACLGRSPHAYLYAIIDSSMSVSDLRNSCEVAYKVPGSLDEARQYPNITYSEIHRRIMMMGFKLRWGYRSQSCKTVRCFFEIVRLYAQGLFFSSVGTVNGWFIPFSGLIEIIFLVRAAIGIPCLFIFLAYKLKRKHIWMDTTVEEFLSKYRYQMPIRYSYSDIKKMTEKFKEILGQGGYGSVFKGKLSNGRLVAIKMLKKSKGDGQEFINEIATIGRIHHVNVVRLLGFCSEGSKRALVYEFMPNGSLEKYIFTQGKSDLLCWNKMYQIAIGIARGIGYLHRGCDMRILHFDIKPHNILLDEKFTPKVSDFGLAKFYPTDESIVSVTAARGTIGYIAPELVYKNVGGISYKSDVYSFGMLLMEMAGRRKNVDATGNTSQVYFPLWIYDQLDQGRDMMMEDDTSEDDQKIAKKLIMVALWCIQIKPIDRPSMNKVIQMLEGSVEDLRMPAKPFISFSEHSLDQDRNSNTDSAESSATQRSGSISQNFVESNVLDVIVD